MLKSDSPRVESKSSSLCWDVLNLTCHQKAHKDVPNHHAVELLIFIYLLLGAEIPTKHKERKLALGKDSN